MHCEVSDYAETHVNKGFHPCFPWRVETSVPDLFVHQLWLECFAHPCFSWRMEPSVSCKTTGDHVKPQVMPITYPGKSHSEVFLESEPFVLLHMMPELGTAQNDGRFEPYQWDIRKQML